MWCYSSGVSDKTEKPKVKDQQLAHFVLPPAKYDYLRDKAHKERISMAELIRRALDAAYGDEPDYPK